jgi:hypothetical protein
MLNKFAKSGRCSVSRDFIGQNLGKLPYFRVYLSMRSIFKTCNGYFYLIRCSVQNLGEYNHSGAELNQFSLIYAARSTFQPHYQPHPNHPIVQPHLH